MSTDSSIEKIRIDKWLWAARFFKTRSLASAAVERGRVLVDDARVKPAKPVAIGNMLEIYIGQNQLVVEVLGLSNKRSAAPIAQKLYCETDESQQRRATVAAQNKADSQPYCLKGRPTKRDRRNIERYKKDM